MWYGNWDLVRFLSAFCSDNIKTLIWGSGVNGKLLMSIKGGIRFESSNNLVMK